MVSPMVRRSSMLRTVLIAPVLLLRNMAMWMASAYLEVPEYTGPKHQLKLSKCGKLSGCKAGMSCNAFDFCRLRTAVAIAGSVSFCSDAFWVSAWIFARSLCRARRSG